MNFLLQTEEATKIVENLMLPDSVQKAQLAETVTKIFNTDYTALTNSIIEQALWIGLKIILALAMLLTTAALPVHAIDTYSKERNEIIAQMAERGIASNVHYKPLPMMTAYKNMVFDIQNYPNAYAHFANEITLPLHTRLTDEEVEYIIENYISIVTAIKQQG